MNAFRLGENLDSGMGRSQEPDDAVVVACLLWREIRFRQATDLGHYDPEHLPSI